MYKLLNASFSRLRKNKIFIGLVILTVIIAIFMLVSKYLDKIKYSAFGISSNTTDILFTSFINIIGFFSAIFTSLFVGTEYSDGTIRNKIIVGHSRKNIYLSNLIVSIVVGLILEFIYLIIISIVAIPVFGKTQMDFSQFVFVLLDMVMIVVSYSSIFNFIALTCSNITISTVSSLLLILIMFVVSSLLLPTANSTEYIQKSVGIDEQGNTKYEIVRNEEYPGKLKQTLCRTIVNLLPTGQAVEISGNKVEVSEDYLNNIKVFPLYSLEVVIVISLIGIYLFNIKELK